MTQTYWNGEPAECVRGTGVMVESPDFPKFWGEHLIGERVPVVKVKYGDAVFYLYDQDNLGWYKVTECHGLPYCGHRNLDVEKFIPDEVGA